MTTALYVVQIILAITLITVILLQVNSAFGGSDASIYTSRRGIDKVLFNFTIILAAAFLLTSVVVLLVTRV